MVIKKKKKKKKKHIKKNWSRDFNVNSGDGHGTLRLRVWQSGRLSPTVVRCVRKPGPQKIERWVSSCLLASLKKLADEIKSVSSRRSAVAAESMPTHRVWDDVKSERISYKGEEQRRFSDLFPSLDQTLMTMVIGLPVDGHITITWSLQQTIATVNLKRWERDHASTARRACGCSWAARRRRSWSSAPRTSPRAAPATSGRRERLNRTTVKPQVGLKRSWSFVWIVWLLFFGHIGELFFWRNLFTEDWENLVKWTLDCAVKWRFIVFQIWWCRCFSFSVRTCH